MYEDKKISFMEPLSKFQSIQENLEALQMLTIKNEEDRRNTEKELTSSIMRDIFHFCSNHFVTEMNTQVSKELKNISMLSSGKLTNLEYLSEIIFYAITKTSSPIGLEHFIAPGSSLKESEEFVKTFLTDFMRIAESFELCMKKDPNVNIGHALVFYKK